MRDLTKVFTSGYVRTTSVVAVKDVSFDLKKGEILALVGESGSGKTTIANIILRLTRPTSGLILLNDKDIRSYDVKSYYSRVQQIFQDPYSSYNSFYKIDRVLNKAFALREDHPPPEEQKGILVSALNMVGLNPDEILGRYPHQMSGGQLQRVLIARFLIIGAELLIADEPTSMIDASSRAAVLNILLGLKKRKTSVIFITHDVGQAQHIADKVVVMNKGKLVEKGSAERVFSNPKHPYTKRLLADVPKLYEKWEF